MIFLVFIQFLRALKKNVNTKKKFNFNLLSILSIWQFFFTIKKYFIIPLKVVFLVKKKFFLYRYLLL